MSYPLASYNRQISVWRQNEIIDGIELKVKAVYRCLIENSDTKELSIVGCKYYYTDVNTPFKLAPPVPFELIAKKTGFVRTDGPYAGMFIGNLFEVQQQFGVMIPDPTYVATGEDGEVIPEIFATDQFTIEGIMPEYDFYMQMLAGTESLLAAALQNSTKI